MAVSADGSLWFLLNASPEVRAQIESFQKLHPRRLRDTPMAGVVFTNGDLDHCLGLLSLRESQRLVGYATARVQRGFVEGNAFYRTLERFEGQLSWHRLGFDEAVPLVRPDGEPSGLTVQAFPVPGKAPLHALDPSPDPEHNVGLRIRDERNGSVLSYLSGVAGPSDSVTACAAQANAVFFDGTFWTRDELVSLGVGERYAEDMAHWPVGGQAGSLEFLRGLPAGRKLLIHVNNTNPLLVEDSPERALIAAAGVEVAEDGLEFSL